MLRCLVGQYSPMHDPVRSEIPKHRLLPGGSPAQEPKQRRLMVAALTLLLVSLAFVLYGDRDFWFPDAEEATDPLEAPSTFAEVVAKPASKPATVVHKKVHARPAKPPAVAPVVEDAAPPLTVTRTVLPPLEIEVVAGTVHRTVRPGSNSVRVDMQTEENAESAPPKPSIQVSEVPANITTNAAERAPTADDPADVVSHSVQPGYPMLARQMKVQGAVTLQALIGRDGLIQDLHVVSGPPILAKAALEAVRQWHFKPHYQGAETVETEAKITVNFTISTN
jgi:TonB family protein